ncbi:MAG: hypothetical protein ABJE10_01490 [bacterium]
MRLPHRLSLSALAALALIASPVRAQDTGVNFNVRLPDSVAHIVPRANPASGAYAITSKDGSGALVLLDTTIVMQFTDRGLDRMKNAGAATDSIKGTNERMIARMVLGALQPVFDHGIAYHLRDLSTAQYADGRLQLKRRNGEEVFRDVKLNNTPLMANFSEQDATIFARKVSEARAKLRT